MHPTKLPIFIKKFSWAAAFCLATPSLFATSLTVNVAGDANVFTAGTFAGSSGDLRGVLNFINQHPDTYDVTFALGGSNTITLGAMLPILNLVAANTVTMDGANGGTQIVIDGASTYRGFFAEQGTISLQNLTIQNVDATGGAGGNSLVGGGGGGMGAGAGLFIDQAAVTVSNVTINNASSVGGAGGAGGTISGQAACGAGGGGMGGAGGDGGISSQYGSGGGGGLGGIGGFGATDTNSGGGGGIDSGINFTGAGGNATAGAGSAGGGIGGAAAGAGGAGAFGSGGAAGDTGGGGGGGGSGGGSGGGGGVGGTAATGDPTYLPGTGGFGGGGGGAGAGAVAVPGGDGGFGGGGGGCCGGFSGVGAAGSGGFGGGGGGSGNAQNTPIGGTGGFGGGGGGTYSESALTVPGPGGVGGGKGGGGAVSTGGGGGGGAGFGGAIFVNSSGSLTVDGAFISGTNTTNFGAAGTNLGVQGWNAGDHAFFVTGSTNTYDPNGSTITISSTLADDSAASFVGAPVGVTAGAATGAVVNIGALASTAGTVVFSADNTYGGGTNIDKGTLTVTGSITGPVSMNTAGTLFNVQNSFTIGDFSGVAGSLTNLFTNNLTFGTATASVTYAGDISGATGVLTKQGSGIAILSGTNTYTAGTVVSAGTLQINSVASLPSGGNVNTSVSGAKLDIASAGGTVIVGDLSGVAGSLVALGANNLTFVTATPTVTYAGNISGASGSLTKQGSGIQILSGTNTYTGGTIVSAGTLQINAVAALPSTGAVNTSVSGTKLDISSAGGAVTVGDLSGVAGSLVTLGANNLTFGTATPSVTYAGNISGASGSLTKQGSGIAILSGTNTYAGGTTTVNAGTLQINTLTSLPSGTNVNTSGATAVLDLSIPSGTFTIGDLNGVSGSSVTLGTNDLIFGTATTTTTFSGGILGTTSAVTKTGSGTALLLGPSTYAGGTSFNQGTLGIGAATALGSGTVNFGTNNGNILQAEATLTIANPITLSTNGTIDSNGFTFTLSGAISGAGSLTKIGLGTLALPNSNSYGGGTNLNQGTLQVGNNTSLNTAALVFDVNNGSILQSGAAALNVANSITLNTNGVVDSNGNTFTLSGAISGTGSLTKTGTGTLILPNGNSYVGTFLDQGTIRVGNATSLGNGTLTFETNSGNILQSGAANLVLSNAIVLTNNGSVDTNSNTLTLSGGISGASILTKIGAGTLILANANTYTGGTHLDLGTLQVGNNTSLGTNTLTFETNSGNILQSGTAALNVANPIVLTNNGSVDTNSNTLTLSGGISGASILTKIGAGTLMLPNANTYTGGTHLDLGTLQVGNNTSLGTNTLTFETNSGNILQSGAANLVLGNAIVLTSNGSVDTNSNTLTLSGGISGASILTKIGAGTLILPNANTYTGGTHLDLGTLQVGNNTSLGTNTLTFETNSGNILKSGAAALNMANPIVLNTDGAVDSNGNSFTLSGAISGVGALSKTGTGTLILPNSNSYGGGTNLNQGTLQVGNNTSLNTAALVFGVNNGNILQSGTAALNVANAITLNTNGAVDSNGNTFTLSGAISGAGSLTKIGVGTLIVSGINTYTGGTDISAGILQINSVASLPSGGSVNTSGSGAELDLSSAGGAVTIGDLSGVGGSLVTLGANALALGTSNSTTFDGAISGSTNLTKQGTGTLSVGGANTFSGTIDVSAGTLNVNGSFPSASTMNVASGASLSGTGTVGTVNLSGEVSPGNSIGTLNVVDFTFLSGSNFLLEVSDTASDQLLASGTVTINPGSTVSLAGLGLNSPLPSYTFITSALPLVGSGNFTLINSLPRFNFSLSYDVNNVFLLLDAINPVNAFTATGNAAGVAKAFNVMLATNPNAPGLSEVVDVLSLQTQSQWQDSFNQMQPANMDDMAFAEENVAERVRQTFTTRLFEQRVEACPSQDPWRLWIVPFLEHVHQHGKGDLRGYKENFRGFSTGFDYQFEKHWAITTGFSYADSDVTIVGGNAHGSFKTYAGTVGAIWSGSNFFIDGLVSYLFNSVDAKRKMRFSATGATTVQRKARHNQDTNEAMAHFGTGYDFKIHAGKKGTVNIYPFVDVDYFFLKQQGYVEKGAQSLDLKVYGKDYDLLRPEGGIGFGYAGCFEKVNVNLDATASYIREQRFLGKKTKARFEDGPKKFTVRGLNPRNNLFGTSARITVGSIKNTNVSVSVGYHGEFGAHFVENAGDAEIKLAF